MSKSGKTHYYQYKGPKRVTVHGGRRDPNILGREVSRQMIRMRLSGFSQAECDQWLEDVIQQIEEGEK